MKARARLPSTYKQIICQRSSWLLFPEQKHVPQRIVFLHYELDRYFFERRKAQREIDKKTHSHTLFFSGYILEMEKYSVKLHIRWSLIRAEASAKWFVQEVLRHEGEDSVHWNLLLYRVESRKEAEHKRAAQKLKFCSRRCSFMNFSASVKKKKK